MTKGQNMSTVNKIDENRIAEQIVSILPIDTVARVCSDDRQSIRYAVRAEGSKLRLIVLRRASLRKLGVDPLAAIKIEYLQRELLDAMKRRSEYHYPRVNRTLEAVRKLLMPQIPAVASVS